jgi:hypothetical protein
MNITIDQLNRILTDIAKVPEGEAGAHLNDHQIGAYAVGTLADNELAACEQHLLHCAECCELVERIAEAELSLESAPVENITVPDFHAFIRPGLTLNRLGEVLSKWAGSAAEAAQEDIARLFAALTNHLVGSTRGAALAVRSASSDSSVDRSVSEAEAYEDLCRTLLQALQANFQDTRTFCGPEHCIRLLHRPGQSPVLQARPANSIDWQAFTLVASDDSGGTTRLGSPKEGLPVTRIAELPARIAELSLEFTPEP